MNILDKIVEQRRRRIVSEGGALGCPVPIDRKSPVVPFAEPPSVICEVKRRSPSKGSISADLDPVTQAGRYAAAGVSSISVLTEEDHFSGSLRDLMAVKQEFPNVAVLRKDFLLTEEDIDISYRAGADAVLLIASVLEEEVISSLYRSAVDLGLTPLVEVHDREDVEKVRSFAPVCTGINSRNLKDFSVDLLHPVALRHRIDWETRLIFESGIDSGEKARFAISSGFDAILVGEAVVRKPALIPEILSCVEDGSKAIGADFWARLYARKESSRPLVKVCGLTSTRDAEFAAKAGADLLGFIFAPSPRLVEPGLLRDLGKSKRGDPCRVGVVVTGATGGLEKEAISLLEDGFLDAIQFHGGESPGQCFSTAFPYYKALRPAAPSDTAEIGEFGCPRVLIDAFVAGVAGGTGKRISPSIIEAAAPYGPLWLAGGISPENITEILELKGLELVDVSSGLESEPGKKDHNKIRHFFDAIFGG